MVCSVGSTPTFSSCALCQRVCARCVNNVVVLLHNNECLYRTFEYISNLESIIIALWFQLMHRISSILLLLAACIVTGLQARVLQCNGLHCPRKCLVGIKTDGLLEQHDVQSILGIDLALCGEPTQLANVTSFSVQLLCQGLGYQPKAGVALGDELVTVRNLNDHFQCSEQSLHLEAKSVQEVVDFYNQELTVATCKKVDEMNICGIESRKEAGWVTLQLHVCTEEGKYMHVFRPYETFRGIGVDFKENSRLAEIPNLLTPFEYRNAFVFVPKALLETAVDLFKWTSARNSVSAKGDLSNLRKLWMNLCSSDKSQQDVFSCDKITTQMLQMCKIYRSDDDKRKLRKLETCLEKIHPGDSIKQAEVMDNENRRMCGVLGVEWTIPTELHECMEKAEKTAWHQFGELMTTVKDNVCSFAQITIDAVTYVNAWVDFVLQWSWKIIGVIWANKQAGMFATAWGFIYAVYKFSGRLERDAPGSRSTCYSIISYVCRCVLSPMSLFRSMKKVHKERILRKVHSSLSKEEKFQTKDDVSAYVNNKLREHNEATKQSYTEIVKNHVSSYVNDKLRENNEATKQSYTEIVETYLSQKQIPDTEFVQSLIQRGVSENREKTAQLCSTSIRHLMAEQRMKLSSDLQRSIETILSDANEYTQEPESAKDAMAKVLNPRLPSITENREAGNAERWRGFGR